MSNATMTQRPMDRIQADLLEDAAFTPRVRQIIEFLQELAERARILREVKREATRTDLGPNAALEYYHAKARQYQKNKEEIDQVTTWADEVDTWAEKFIDQVNAEPGFWPASVAVMADRYRGYHGRIPNPYPMEEVRDALRTALRTAPEQARQMVIAAAGSRSRLLCADTSYRAGAALTQGALDFATELEAVKVMSVMWVAIGQGPNGPYGLGWGISPYRG